jgi:hypothetical protein
MTHCASIVEGNFDAREMCQSKSAHREEPFLLCSAARQKKIANPEGFAGITAEARKFLAKVAVV